MSDPISPSKLLDHAKTLAGFGAAPGHPSPTDHRRAVSAAYYALFHELIGRSVSRVFPDASAEECLKIRRWYEHRDVKRVCEQLSVCASATTPLSKAPGNVPEGLWHLFSTPSATGAGRVSAVPAGLVFIVDAFLRLIEARHSADYDHEASFPRATTKSYVLEAETAAKKVRQLSKSPYGRKFLALLLMPARGRS